MRPTGLGGPDRPRLHDLAELVRAPAALTVPGDTLVGAAAAGWPFGRATVALSAAAVCLYWAGMALNDWADRDVDAVERPGRPIPSGRVRPDEALAVAAGLSVAGLLLAGAAGGRRAAGVAGSLAASIWAYDLVLKATPAGPLAMATCRGLDVLLGAGTGRLRAAAVPAGLVAAHTVAVTMLSRGEVGGSSSRTVARTLALTGGVAGGALLGLGGRGGVAGRVAGVASLGVYAATFGRVQLAALEAPDAGRTQHAVGAGIHGLMPLQGALAAGAGAAPLTGLAAAGFVAARRLSRRVSPT